MARVPVFVISPVSVNKLISFKAGAQVNCDWLQVNNINVLLLIFLKFIFRSGIGINL